MVVITTNEAYKTKPDFDASDLERIILLLLYFNLVILLIVSIQLNLK
jgi:hypothetical protein